MPIPKEFSEYSDEDDFVKRFLLPLFLRLGFDIVANYHGKREFGKDLLLGEFDRFSHARYHGVQAKFEPSIGKEAMHGLINQCNEAFVKPFSHPQTGQTHRISSFYAVNAGNVSDEARELFFESLQPGHADNVRILDGRDLLALDRFAVLTRSENVRELLNGLLQECRFDVKVLNSMVGRLMQIVQGDGNHVVYPTSRLRLNAVAAFLNRPALFIHVPLETAELFWSMGTTFNKTLDDVGASPLHTVVSIKNPAINAINLIPDLRDAINAVMNGVSEALNQLGPLAAM